MSAFLIVLGGTCWIAAIHQRLAMPDVGWKDSWVAYAFRGSVFSLAGFAGCASGLWSPALIAAAIGLMTLSAFVGHRRSRPPFPVRDS